MNDIYEEVHEDRPKATEIMTFALTRDDSDAFLGKQGKAARKIRWSDITVRVFV